MMLWIVYWVVMAALLVYVVVIRIRIYRVNKDTERIKAETKRIVNGRKKDE